MAGVGDKGEGRKNLPASNSIVMAGLDPAIHLFEAMDARVGARA